MKSNKTILTKSIELIRKEIKQFWCLEYLDLATVLLKMHIVKSVDMYV